MLIALWVVTIANDELLHMEMIPKTNSVTTKIHNTLFLTPDRLKKEDDLLKVTAPEFDHRIKYTT